ncbi:MAG: MopE-related protein [Myxococcota bacterium]
MDAPPALRSEIGVPVEENAVVVNLDPSLDLVVTGIEFRPDQDNMQWFGAGPWDIPPGESRDIRVWYKPDTVGTSEVTLVVNTDAGPFEALVSLEGLPSIDADGDGFSRAFGDCDDDDAAIFPGAEELCDGVDNDCDEDIDGPFDRDNDGFVDDELCPEELAPLDCNDGDSTAFPGNEESCDGSDSDCNGVIDDINVLADLQEGVCAGAQKVCSAGGPLEPDYTTIEEYERVEFTCDDIDNDCDGTADGFDRLGDGTDDCVDDDGDGEREVDGDCDDLTASVTSETCGFTTLVTTKNSDGFSTIDLNTGRVTDYAFGIRTYHGVAVDSKNLWFAARDEQRILRFNLDSKTGWASAGLGRDPWQVDISPSGDLLVLFGDGAFQRRDVATGGFINEVSLTGTTRAWTPVGDGTYWVCTKSGEVIHASLTAVLSTVELGFACYSAPALNGTRLVVPAFDVTALIELDTTTGDTVQSRVGDNQPIRAIWVKNDLWATTAVDATVDRFNGSTLLYEGGVDLGGSAQGLWYDEQRDLVWVAVYGTNEVVAIDRRTRAIRTRLSVSLPVHLFPLPPG